MGRQSKGLDNFVKMAPTVLLLSNVIVSSPPWDQGGGDDFCVISQAGGATAKLQEPGWGHIQRGGEMILGRQAGGKLLYHDKLLVFPQNASP